MAAKHAWLYQNLAAGLTPTGYSSVAVSGLGWNKLNDPQPRHRARVNSNHAVLIRDLASVRPVDLAALLSTSLISGAHFVCFRATAGEPSCASNYCLRSKDYSDAAWTKENVTIDSNQTVSGPFDSTASNIGETTANAAHAIHNPISQLSTWPAFSYVHVSIYVRAVERSWVQLLFTKKNADLVYQYVNLGTGALGASAGSPGGAFAESLGSGWYRIGFYTDLDAGATTPGIRLALATGDAMGNYPTYAGTTGSGVDVYGAQADLGTVRGGHVGTTSAAYVNEIETGWQNGVADSAYNGNVIWAGTATNVRYARWDINVGAAPIDIGLAPLGLLFRPGRNFQYGAQEGLIDLGARDINPDTGAAFGVSGPKLRTRQLTVSGLTKSEARDAFGAMDLLVGADGDVLFVEDPDESWLNRARDSIWGSFRELGAGSLATRQAAQVWARSFRLTERL
jgi:hypothetical protein